jgi:hypothetical protein
MKTPHSSTRSPQVLYVFFHGPWGFAVHETTQVITALTPVCPGHQYRWGDGHGLQGMPAGNYALADEGAIAGQPNWISQVPEQTQITNMPPRFALPRALDDPRVHCSVTLPFTSLLGYPCVPRSIPHQNDDYDNLLSGRHFSLLNQTTAGDDVSLGLAQVLPYVINDFSRLRLVSDTGFQWLPLPTDSGAVKLHIYAQTTGASSEDHFSTMASLFNLDLHLDGIDVTQNGQVHADPSACFATGQPPITADDLKSLEERNAPPSARPHSRTLKFPIACGGTIVINYDPQAMLAPPDQTAASAPAPMPGM